MFEFQSIATFLIFEISIVSVIRVIVVFIPIKMLFGFLVSDNRVIHSFEYRGFLRKKSQRS